MREKLITELSALKTKIQDAENAVFVAYVNLQGEKRLLQDMEDNVLLDMVEGVKIDGKNAEIRTAQMREVTNDQHNDARDAEYKFEAKKVILSTLRTELTINLALVELVKGVV